MMAVRFVANRVSLLDRGVIFAQAHIRGGGDLGGAVARRAVQDDEQEEHLLRLHLPSPTTSWPASTRRTTGWPSAAASAGGLLIGRFVLNARPDLCRAPPCSTSSSSTSSTRCSIASLPADGAGIPRVQGNPNVKAEYDYIKTYWSGIRTIQVAQARLPKYDPGADLAQ